MLTIPSIDSPPLIEGSFGAVRYVGASTPSAVRRSVLVARILVRGSLAMATVSAILSLM